MVKAGTSCQSFTERMNVVTFKLVGILGKGRRERSEPLIPLLLLYLPLCIYAFDKRI